MTRPEIVVVSPLSEPLIAELGDRYTVHRADTATARAATLARDLSRVAAIIGHHPVDDALLDACPAAGLICTFAAGFENVDATRAQTEGRIVCNTPGASAEEVADSAAMLVLAGMKRLRDLDALVREGRWPAEGTPPPRHGLFGARVGVAGAGDVGRAILRRMAAFGAELHYHSRTPRDLEARQHPTLLGLAEACDVLILALPGGPDTRHAAEARVFAALGADGVLVNLARGSVVDEAALVAALSDGTLGFAALDVFETEPEVPKALRALPNTLFTPHYAGAGLAARQRKAEMLLSTLAAYFDGAEPPYRVL